MLIGRYLSTALWRDCAGGPEQLLWGSGASLRVVGGGRDAPRRDACRYELVGGFAGRVAASHRQLVVEESAEKQSVAVPSSLAAEGL